MDSTAYLDLRNGEREPLFFFMLNAYLQSRIETDHESDGDEEVNVYLAGLLHSLVDGRFYADNVDRLATSALDVCQKAEESGTDRGKTNVYRTNADIVWSPLVSSTDSAATRGYTARRRLRASST